MRPVSVLESVSERKAGRLAEFGVESVLDLVTTYPRRYIDRTRQADVSGLEVGDEAAVLASVQSARSRAGPQRARRGRPRCARRDGTAGRRLLQPALAGQAARSRYRGDLLRQGRRVPGCPPDGESDCGRGGGRDPGAPDAPHPARLPGLGQGGSHVVGDRRVRGGGTGAGRRLRRPVAAGVALDARPVGPDRGVRRASTCPSRSR